MTCDQCRHQADVRAGKYRDVVFGRTPCSKCDWQEPSLDNTMEYDDENTPASAHEALLPAARPDSDVLPVSVLIDAMRILLRLRPETRDVVCMRARGMTYPAIARVFGRTVAAVEMRHVRALRQAPVLGELFGAKVASQRLKSGGRKLTGTGRFGQP